jgi:hypothetical protein
MRAGDSNLHFKPATVIAVACSGAMVAALWGSEAIGHTRTRAELQQVADRAALAGVTALVNASASGTTAQTQAAVVASDSVTAQIADSRSTVRPLPADKTVTVEISATPHAHFLGVALPARPITVTGRAGYIGPDDSGDRSLAPVATEPERKVKDALAG